MTTLVITDTHFCGKHFSAQLESYANILEDLKPAEVLHLGDLYDRGEVGDLKLLAQSQIAGFVEVVNRFGIPHRILAGNHDYVEDACSLDFFHHPLITTHKEIAQVELACGHTAVLFPWIHGGRQQVLSTLKQIQLPEAWLAFGHSDLDGFTHKGRELTASSSAYCLDPRWFTKRGAQLVWFGHIHDTDLKQDEMFGYLGSAWPQDFGEVTHPGRVGLITAEEAETFAVGDIVMRFHDADADPDVYRRLSRPSRCPRVFVRGAADPPELPPNVTFTRRTIRQKKERSTRLTGAVDLDQALRQYLGSKKPSKRFWDAWELFKPHAEEQAVEIPPIRKVRVQSFGCLEDKSAQFGDGLNLLTGPSGRGKTTFLEAIPVTLFGKFPDGRQVGKMARSTSSLVVSTDTDTIKRKWSEPRYTYNDHVSDTEFAARVRQTFGVASNFLSTSFISQERSAFLVNTGQAERLALLRKLFGLDGFDVQLKKVKEKVKNLAYSPNALESAKIQLEDQKRLQKMTQDELKQWEKRKREKTDATERRQELKGRMLEAKARLDQENRKLTKLRQEDMTACSRADGIAAAYKAALAQFQIRVKKAGCRDNPLPCPLLQEPEKPPKPEIAKRYPKGFDGDIFCKQPAVVACLQEIEKLEKAFTEIETQMNAVPVDESENVNTAIKEAEKRLQFTKNAIDRLTTQIADLEENVADLKVFTELAEVLGPFGLSQWYLEQRLPELEDSVNTILSEFPEIGYTVRLEFSKGNKENLQILLIDENPERDVRYASGGQKTLIGLAMVLALSSGTLLLDEPFTGLHPNMISLVARFLAAQDRQIIAVTHDPAVRAHAGSVVTF